MISLDIAQENIRFMIRVQVDELDLTGEDAAEGRKLTTLALYWRLEALARYLATADAADAFAAMARAAQARLLYTERLAKGQAVEDERYASTASNRAFFDAAAAGLDAEARRLADRADGRWARPFEYEDDFLFAHLVQRLYVVSLDGASDPDVPALLTRFEEVAGADVPELLICTALHDRDDDRFSEALEAIIAQRDTTFAEREDLPPEVQATERHIYVTGLALVKLARRLGMRTRAEYHTIPGDLLDAPPGAPAPPNGYRTLS